ncbi:MAG: hypothetical protein Q9209_006262 [Squamulea sp. 1 TL-2023]
MTSDSTCCACGDKRPHAPSFSRYIDGVGSTRIPIVPDQTNFIKQWFDWHRGYSTITNSDGTEERQALIGESLSEVDIGYLPRTIEELHRGITLSSNTQDFNTQENDTRPSITSASRFNTDDIDPEDRIFDSLSSSESSHDSVFEDASDHSRSTYQQLLLDLQQNVEDIRANVDRLTRRIPPNRTPSQVSTISSNLTSITTSIDTIRQNHGQTMELSTISNSGDTRVSERPALEDRTDDYLRRWTLLLSTQIQRVQNTHISVRNSTQVVRYSNFLNVQLHRAERERRRREGPAPVFGTREEVERQGQDYRSPLTTLFTRAAPEQTHAQNQRTTTTDPQPQALQQIQRSSNSSIGLSGSEHSDVDAQAREFFQGPAGLPTSSADMDGSSLPSPNPYGSRFLPELDSFEALITSILSSPGSPEQRRQHSSLRSSDSERFSLQDGVPRAGVQARPHYQVPETNTVSTKIFAVMARTYAVGWKSNAVTNNDSGLRSQSPVLTTMGQDLYPWRKQKRLLQWSAKSAINKSATRS